MRESSPKRSGPFDERLLGTWVSTLPWNSDDYLVEYTVSRSGSRYRVQARDYCDGEAMVISHLRFDGITLEFRSLMPSTGRTGVNRFTAVRDNTIRSEFTFTVIEDLKQISASANRRQPHAKRPQLRLRSHRTFRPRRVVCVALPSTAARD